MSKFTSGPWTAHTRRLPVAISHAPEMLLGLPHESAIGDTGIANARLIAAAPEMAELLKLLADIPIQDFGWDKNPDQPLHGWNGHALYARDVIAARAILARLEAE